MSRSPDPWTDPTALQVGSGLPGDTIDRSQETYRPSPYAARVTPPSGDVTPDGRRAWPQPSLASRILVWGGIAAGAAAATAGAVLAVRAVVDGVAGSDEDDAVEEARERARARARRGKRPQMPRNAHAGGARQRDRGLAPRFADMSDDEREAMRARVEARREADRSRVDAARRAARPAKAQSSGGGLGFLHDINRQVGDVTRDVTGAIAAVSAAIEGFRSVSGQAGSIMQEFRSAADQVKTMFDGGPDRAPVVKPGERADTRRRTAATDEAPMVDLRDETAGDPRTHRL